METWEENYNNCETAEEYGVEAYGNQPVEKEAREAGRGFINSLTPEELEKYKFMAGVD